MECGREAKEAKVVVLVSVYFVLFLARCISYLNVKEHCCCFLYSHMPAAESSISSILVFPSFFYFRQTERRQRQTVAVVNREIDRETK